MTAALLLLKRFWYAIPILALVVALTVTRGTLADVKGERDGLKAWQTSVREVTSRAADIRTKDGGPALLALEQVPVQITYLGQGLERVSVALAAKNKESDLRARQLAEAIEQDRRNREEADRQFAASRLSIDRLRALAARPSTGICPADPSLLRELEGL